MLGNGNNVAYRWTQDAGMVTIDTVGGINSWANAASSDGRVVVGYANFNGSYTGAFRWTQATGMVNIDTINDGRSSASALSSDGGVVVGYVRVNSGNTHAFRWTQTTGMVDIDTAGGTASWANAISADGRIVVGGAKFNGGNAEPFRWTQSTGMVDLGNLGGTFANANELYILGYGSHANGLSSDGSVIVGASYLADNTTDHAFRWTQSTGMVDLGTLGGTASAANAVSGNGKIVVGVANLTGNTAHVAFRWTQATGMQDLNTLLSNAGVDMSGIQLQYATGISPDGRYISGQGFFSGTTEAFLVSYIDDSVDKLTTASDVRTSAQNLAADQRASLIESRSTAGELLGLTRPVDNGNYSYAGAMFGSAAGYTGGQYSARGVTILGGIAYGSEEYTNIKQGAAPTLALAARYTFDDPFGDEASTLHPYAELGSWVTPRAPFTLTRHYANGSGTSTGTGSSTTTSWAEYARAGLLWNATPEDSLTGYTELGQQYMNFTGYTETSTATNPFPATIDSGTLSMNVARLGGLWTHKLDIASDAWGDIPVSITFAGNAARSFDVHPGLTVNVSGIGTTTAANKADTWGEFGTRLTAGLTSNLDLNLDLNGTTGDTALGTAIHGGVGVSYRF